MTKKQKRNLAKIIISAILFTVGLLLPFEKYKIIPFLIAYIIVGYSPIIKAFKNLFSGQVFDENFLMLIATVGAIVLREYSEAVAVMLFYQVGELFESVAVGKSRKSISSLVDLAAEFANRVTPDGEIEQIEPELIEVGDILLVKPGEKIPVDGVITKGNTSLDTSALTGESLPREAGQNDEVLSGCINLGAAIEIRAEKEFENSAVSKIMYLVEEATGNKSKSESFITRFARYYTPAVVGVAVLVAVIPSLITHEWAKWISRALLFLVVSCPCALVISVPLSFFCAIGRASRKGILIKGSNFIELIAKANTAVFDKTGTLTKGSFHVEKIVPHNVTGEELLKICAYAESYIDHPIANSVKNAYGEKIDLSAVGETVQHTGCGVESTVFGKKVLVGNEELMKRNNIVYSKADEELTVLYCARDNEYIGYIIVADEVKDESVKTVDKLNKLGIDETVMLTGDNEKIGNYIGKKIGLSKVFASLLPTDKVDRLKEIKNAGKTVIYTGDGLNDAPVIIEADVGIAMGSMGSDAAIEAADIVIMDDNISKLPEAIKISRKTMKIVKENIVFALGVKFAIMLLGLFGLANMWLAVFADVGVSVLAILNAMRK